jgi:hypothetical protein
MTPTFGFVPPLSRGLEPRETPIPVDGEIVELSLLLPRWQAVALESAARDQGISAGQMLRRIIGESVRATSVVTQMS